MRLALKTKPRHGDRRVVTRFLLFPKVLYCMGERQMRWLERASWQEVYWRHYGWEPQLWVDKA